MNAMTPIRPELDRPAIARAICAHLPFAHRIVITTPDEMDKGSAHLLVIRESDGLPIWLRCWHHDARFLAGIGEKIRQSGFEDVPDMHGFGILKHDEKRPECTMAANRSPAQMAREVMRKVVEPAGKLWPAYLDRVGQHRGARDARKEAAKECRRLLNDGYDYDRHPHRGNRETEYACIGGAFRTGRAYGGFEFQHGNTVKLEIHSLTHEDAIALSQWIATRNRPLGTE